MITSTDSGGAPSSTTDDTFLTLSSGAFTSDDFDAADLNTDLWEFVNPLGDASYQVSGAGTQDARLSIVVPGGASHDPWGSNDAPRVMQVADDTDFQIEVKLESVLDQAYQSQGVIVEQDSQNWLRFDFYHNGSTLYAFAVSVSGGVPDPQVNAAIWSGPSPTMWLRVTRAGNLWTHEYSFNGTDWNTSGSFSAALTVGSVGLFGGNFSPSGSAPAQTALFDYIFDTAAPIVPEDGGGGAPQALGDERVVLPSGAAPPVGADWASEARTEGAAPERGTVLDIER
jgi:regulation of enolase protein 1 (concanavalin A-like superfamily)